MISWIADNVITPLGTTSQQNYEAVKAGVSAVCCYRNHKDIPEPFAASLFSDEQNANLAVEGLSRFESLAYWSVRSAVDDAGIDVADSRVLFILSTTKANIDTLSPSIAADKIARRIGFTTQPVVVCNACISGVSAIVLALRMLEAGTYDYAVVCGADIQNKFTISGFQSLKALSEEPCRPFDLERTGLNLGEAAATVVLSRGKRSEQRSEDRETYCVVSGAVRNDAFHITSPSKDGEGARLALTAVLDGADTSQLAFVNAHGTATMFNDQMESKAIERAGLGDVPVNGLKGYFGHTLGAAGVLETVLSLYAVKDNTVLATKGFEERGVSGKINIVAGNTPTPKRSFVKMISGFGGCNGAIVVSEDCASQFCLEKKTVPFAQPSHSVHITPTQVIVDGEPIQCSEKGRAMIVELYRSKIGDYPKFYKMDDLSRLGFVAAELMLKTDASYAGDRAVILFNNSSSVQADKAYMETIKADNYFPSPSIFIYTLPNIVTGEIAIRHNYHCETSFYILDRRNDSLAESIISASFVDNATQSILWGWLDYRDDNSFEAELYITDKQK